MKRCMLLISLLLSWPLSLLAKPTVIDIKTYLRDAAVIRKIVVIDYPDSTTMRFIYKNQGDTLIYKNQLIKDAEWYNALTIKNATSESMTSLASTWPKLGQEVLFISDTAGYQILFAVKIREDYRLWDPMPQFPIYTYFQIPNEKGFSPLKECNSGRDLDDKGWVCWDGCLINTNLIHERGMVR